LRVSSSVTDVLQLSGLLAGDVKESRMIAPLRKSFFDRFDGSPCSGVFSTRSHGR
jgi:hypothetical protein